MQPTTKFTAGKSPAQLQALAEEVSKSLKNISNQNSLFPLTNRSLTISKAITEVMNLSKTGKEVINAWHENKEWLKITLQDVLNHEPDKKFPKPKRKFK